MKIAFATTVTRSYLPYLRALLNSIKINSPSVTDAPFICFTGGNDTAAIKKMAKDYPNPLFFDAGLTPAEKRGLKELYPAVEFKKVDIAKYSSTEKFNPHFWRIEVLNLAGYDSVIFIDADMLCLKDISRLVKIQCDIGTTEQTTGWKDWNWGLFIVGKKYLNAKSYKWLLNKKHDRKAPAEPMHLFTKLFGQELYEIPQKYNRIVPQLSASEIAAYEMIHYIYKPFTDLERLIQPEYLELWKKYSV